MAWFLPSGDKAVYGQELSAKTVTSLLTLLTLLYVALFILLIGISIFNCVEVIVWGVEIFLFFVKFCDILLSLSFFKGEKRSFYVVFSQEDIVIPSRLLMRLSL